MTRALLPPNEATNEGARRLRMLLRKSTAAALARRLKCDERSVRAWAREECKPSLVVRARFDEALEIYEEAWDEAPDADVYASEPATERKGVYGGPRTHRGTP